jgi:FtsP/CotA-like multicopper oxidase with cupredoxin domain
VILTNDASYPYPNGNAANERNSVVMKFVVAAEDGNDDAAQVPARLVHVPRLSDEDRANVTSRDIIFTEAQDAASAQPTRLLINFRTFADPVTETPRIGSTEMWRVINLTPDNHPLHIHLVGFQVLHDRKLDELTASSMFGGLLSCVTRRRGDADGCRLARYYDAASPPLPPPPTDSGFKNVYKVPPFSVTSLLVRFALADGRPGPFDAAAPPGYAYHCHVSDHIFPRLPPPPRARIFSASLCARIRSCFGIELSPAR